MRKGRSKKLLPALALFLALLAGLAPSASALVEQSESFYVADYANVLSDSLEQSIVDCNGRLESECDGAQIVVVTVDYLDGMYADDYAYELFNDWGVGSAERNNGMLLLLGVQEGKAWLAYGLGLDLDSGWADDMLERTFWDAFDRGDYESAVSKLFTGLVDWYEQSYSTDLTGAPVNVNRGPAYTAPPAEEHSLSFTGVITVIVVILILFAVIRSLFRPLRWFRPRYRRAPPPPPLTYGRPYRRRQPPPPPPYGGAPRRPSAPPRPSRPPSRPSSPPRSGLGGSGRGGRPGGFSGGSRPSGRGGGGFSGGGGGRR